VSTWSSDAKGSLPSLETGENVPPSAEALATQDDTVRATPARRLDRWLLSKIGGALGEVPIRVVLWDGTQVCLSRRPRFTFRVKDRRTLLEVAWYPELHFGEAYGDGRVEVEGDLEAFLRVIYRAREERRRRSGRRRSFLPWLSNTIRRSRDNVHHHYDLGNEFYELWLDRELVYTCAYFPSADITLEQAQHAKMDYVCRKLRLKPGETVVEAGCGWGALALYMARHYGVQVKAFNISREQLSYARKRAEAEGLRDRVEFIEGDYRDIDVRADAFVSVGMLEHVGIENFRSLGEVIRRCLGGEHGRGLLHFIGRDRPGPLNPWIRRHIFPGAYAPTLGEVFGLVLEPVGFTVVDVENLRLHYAKTLAHWKARFKAAQDRVLALFGPRFVRAWRLYLAGSQAAFHTGTLHLFQVVFASPSDPGIPPTRADWYLPGNGK
jgi:cyclopropane-fatty-acyl-phospholipid synthase